MIQNKNVQYDGELNSRLSRAAEYIKQTIHPVAIKELALAFGDQYLYTRYMLNTGTIVNIGANVMNSSFVTNLSRREPIDTNIVASFSPENQESFVGVGIGSEIEEVQVT